MATEIYCFSGTGNSLFVARELQRAIPDSVVIPIVSLLGQSAFQTQGKAVGFVFPCHALTVPLAVKRFMKRVDMQSAEYVFAIATRYGTVFRGFEMMEKLLRKKGKKLDARFILNMCHNEAPRSEKGYKVPSRRDILKVEEAVLQKLSQIRTVILERETFHEHDAGVLVQTSSSRIAGFFVEKLVVSLLNISEHIGGVNYFYHDDACNGCGVCEKVCLSDKIRIFGGAPVWQRDVLCYMCYACLNFCPQKSVQVKDIPGVKSYSTENDRYPHPYASVADIMSQKGPRVPSMQGTGAVLHAPPDTPSTNPSAAVPKQEPAGLQSTPKGSAGFEKSGRCST